MQKNKSKTPIPTGATILIKCLENQGVEYIFGIPGGYVIPIYDALVNSKIKLILVRHEQAAVHMADGYARATGRPGVVCVTSGPGSTNIVTGVMTASMDSIPVIVFTGQTTTTMLGTDSFQEADTSGITMPIVKHSYLVKDTNAIPRIVKEAFYIATTGRPGPIIVDLPKDITAAPYTGGSLNPSMDIPGYSFPTHGNLSSIKKFAKMFKGSKKPLLLVGHGAVIARADKILRAFVEKLQSPAANTLLGKGAFPETHPLSLGMIGMHGTAYANKALINCDLICSIGARFDDRVNSNNEEFCIGAKKLHIDIDDSEIGKVVKPDAAILGDARLVLEELIKHVEPLDTKEWIKELEYYRKQFPLSYPKDDRLHAQQVIEEVYKISEGKALVATDVGQNQMWSAQFYLCDRSDQWLSSGGAGTMGYGFPAAIGAQFGRPDQLVIAICGDGGFQMTMYELATIRNHKLPVKIIIIDNKFLGMVRQWQELFWDNRLSGVDLEGNPDFVKLAAAYDIKGFHINHPHQVHKVLTEALNYPGPCVIHAEVVKEGHVFPMVPAGKSAYHMIIEPPKAKTTKSTTDNQQKT
jgi:acetolactate synthase I/II/III large subunit